MSVAGGLSLSDLIGGLFSHFGQTYFDNFFSFGGGLAIPSLLSALLVAAACVWLNKRPSRRRVKLKVLVRAFFPRRIMAHRSTGADVGLFVLNTSIFTVLLGWAILSSHVVAAALQSRLVGTFGAMAPSTLVPWQLSLIMMVALFLAYELSYYIDHYLAHSIPFLWEFHKVHHAAEVLTPATNYRVHPIDSLVYYNIVAVVMGCTMAGVNYLSGVPVTGFSIAGQNVLLLVFIYLFGHLQHSHFWIAFTGLWGRLLLSPAHHQIHHSTNPVHFNTNLGHCLAVFDWLFGTLHVPTAKREKLTFGVDPRPADPHSITETLMAPFGHAMAHVLPKKNADVSPAPADQHG